MDMDPNAPPPVFHQLKPIYPELPTKPTQIQQLMQNLSSLDIKSIERNLNALLTKLDTTVGGLQMAEINQGITNLLTSINRLVTAPDITNALASIKPTLDQYRELGAKLTSKVDPLADSITNSLTQADRALAQLRGAGENLRTLLAPDAPLRNDLDQALEQLAGAAQSISSLVDFLKQHPNALITGRQLPKKQP
jgi:paraquat-inducible protein B